MKLTNHHNLRKRTAIDASRPVLTEQQHKNSCDINHIVAQYNKTGVMPEGTRIPQYIDNTSIPSLEEAFSVVKQAQEAFLDLPANIRRLMDNDPAKMEQFLSDKDNTDILVKYGVLEIKTPPVKEPTLGDVINQLKENNKTTEKD